VFIGANPPLLLDYGIDMLMKLPENFKALDDATKERLRYQVSQSILIHTYETRTTDTNPVMHKAMQHPHGQTLKQVEAFSGGTWDNCLFPFEECLIRMALSVNNLSAIKFPWLTLITGSGITSTPPNHVRTTSQPTRYSNTTTRQGRSTRARNSGKSCKVS
jgi:hypothetical protein